MKIYFASGNAHKKEEMARILSSCEIVIPADEGIEFDPEETENSFYGNSLIKAKALYEIVREPVIADDSGICVDALGGAPGVLSARYGSENGKKLSAEERNALLLSRMHGVENRICRFVCNMMLYLGNDRFISVQETLEGELITESRGTGGFGYDPIVFIPSYGKTVAELSGAEKDFLSHRGKAGRKIADFLSRGI
jgi:non-canonical purine NTP pyrophosphatase, rdgB/HAM1 family